MNFRRVMTGIDTRPLLRQIYANKQLWNSDDSWIDPSRGTVLADGGYAHENIVLRWNKSTPTNPNWNKWAFTLLSEAQPIILRLMAALPGEILGRVMISRMHPGDVVKPHADITMIDGGPSMMPFKVVDPNAPRQRTPVPPMYQRYQIPIYARHGVDFICNGERIHMEPGEAWWFDNQKLHSVENNSNDVRISMLADIRPFTPID